MTAIINCKHATIKGGFGRIQQWRGKRKIEGKPRSEFTMENTTERVTQNKQGTPKSTSENSLPSIRILIYKAHCGVPWSSVPRCWNPGRDDCAARGCTATGVGCTATGTTSRSLSSAEQLEQPRICYAVCINCTSKYTAKIPTGLWKIPMRNPTDFVIFRSPIYNAVHVTRWLSFIYSKTAATYLSICFQKNIGKKV